MWRKAWLVFLQTQNLTCSSTVGPGRDVVNDILPNLAPAIDDVLVNATKVCNTNGNMFELVGSGEML